MVLGLFSAPTPFKGQEYGALRKAAVESGHPYIDQEFPPDDKALFTTKGKLAGIQWKRPKELCDNPQLFVEGASSGDVTQGSLGNCWFVAASSCLAQSKEIWSKVIPNYKEQEWNHAEQKEHPGIFHFQFWRYGQWIDVVIDDFLPTRNNQLVFVHSKSRNEFWSALLEKAYAKLFGCYEALDGGELAEALEDFTGGIAEPIDLVEGGYSEDETKKEDLFKTMKKCMDNRALMAAAIPAKTSEEMEQAIDVGLVKGHAYGITAVKRVAIAGTGIFNMFNQDKIRMVRLRNPWGEGEWKGAFSDGSEEWNKIDKNAKEKIGLTFDDDGEFWMTFDDYCTYFPNMSICRVVNTSFFSLSKKWFECVCDSEWCSPNRNGGCINNRDTFLNNPQFVFDVSEPEDEVLLGLMQKSERGCDVEKLTIGFSIIRVEMNRRYRCHQIQEVVKSSTFKNSRSIFLRHTLKKGRYVVVACTFEPGHNSGIYFRIYTSASNHGKELNLDKPEQSCFNSICGCFLMCKYPVMITRVKVIRALGLARQDKVGGSADPYAIMKCEGEEVYTPMMKDTTSPEWNTSAIFYRKKPMQKEITIEIWNSNTLRDEFMGQYTFQGTEQVTGQIKEVPLAGKKGDAEDASRPGKLFIEVTTSNQLTFL